MRTAIDATALWAIFKSEASAIHCVHLFSRWRTESRLVLCDIVLAEVAPLFSSLDALEEKLDVLGIEFDPIGPQAAFLAGRIFHQYRLQGGPRQHLIPDFLVGAHAMCQADQLIAYDRGYLRRYFPQLKLLVPGPQRA